MRVTIKYGEALGVAVEMEPQEFTEVVETLFAGMANVAQQQAVRQNASNVMAELAKRTRNKTNDNPTEA